MEKIKIGIIGTGSISHFHMGGYTARFNGTVREVLRFSVLLMIWHPIRTLEVFACLAAGLVLALGLPGMALVAPAGVY